MSQRDIPIIMSAPMVRALLDGRKTMTRRIAWGDEKKGGLVKIGCRPSPWQRVKPGDRLWVRETFYETDKLTRSGFLDGVPTPAVFRADWPESDWRFAKWTSPIHMRLRFSRLTLVVTAVKIERLQEISEGDARAEGILYVPGHGDIQPSDLAEGFGNYLCSRMGFEILWNTLHGPASWDANPEVVAISFDVHKQNIDTMPKAEAA